MDADDEVGVSITGFHHAMPCHARPIPLEPAINANAMPPEMKSLFHPIVCPLFVFWPLKIQEKQPRTTVPLLGV